MIKHPARGRAPLGVILLDADPLGGISTEQVVEGEAAGSVLGSQVRFREVHQRAARLPIGDTACAASSCASALRPAATRSSNWPASRSP